MAQAYISSISAPQFSCAFLYPCLVALLALGDCWEKNCIAGVSGNQGWGGFFSCVRVFFLVPAKLFVFLLCLSLGHEALGSDTNMLTEGLRPCFARTARRGNPDA